MSYFSEFLQETARRAAQTHGLDPDEFVRQIQQESQFNPRATGPPTRTGERAQGIAQFMPGTAKDEGLADPYEPVSALEKAAGYRRHLNDTFGSPELGLAAYNAGPGNVAKYGTVPPFPETQEYVRKIRYGQNEAAPARQAPPPDEFEKFMAEMKSRPEVAQSPPPAQPEQAADPAPADDFAPPPDPNPPGFMDRFRAEKARLGGRSDFEVMTGRPYEQFAEEHPFIASTLGTARSGLVGGLLRKTGGQVPDERIAAIQGAEQTAEQSLSTPASAAATGIGFLPDAGAMMAGSAAAAPLVGPVAAGSLAGGAVLGGGAALQGAPLPEVLKQTAIGAAIPPVARGVGAVLPRGVLSQTAGHAAVGVGAAAASGGDLREMEKNALLFGVPRMFGGPAPARRHAIERDVVKGVKEQFREFAATPTPKTSEAMVDVTKPVTERPRAETPQSPPPPPYNPLDVSVPISGVRVYHGTKRPLETLAQADIPQYGAPGALAGMGLYVTDNPTVAGGYSKTKGSGATGKVLSATLNNVKLFDADAPMPEAVRAAVSNILGEPPKSRSLMGAIQEVREYLMDEGYSVADATEPMMQLSDNIRDAGWDGLKYEGGRKIGKTPHNAIVLFAPTPATKNGQPITIGKTFEQMIGDVRAETPQPTPKPRPAPPPPPSGQTHLEGALAANEAEVMVGLREATEAGKITLRNRSADSLESVDLTAAQPTLETALNTTRLKQPIRTQIAGGLKKRFVYLAKMKGPELANDKEFIRQNQNATSLAKADGVRAINGLGQGLSKKQYELYRRFAILKDFEYTALSYKELPLGNTLDQVRAEIAKLAPAVQSSPAVQAALGRHKRLTKGLFDDQVARGNLEAPGHLPASTPLNDWYVPHEVLNWIETGLQRPGAGFVRRFVTPRRAYNMGRKGSDLAIETDYMNVMYRRVAKQSLHNRMADMLEQLNARSGDPSKLGAPFDPKRPELEYIEFEPNQSVWSRRERALPERVLDRLQQGLTTDAEIAKAFGLSEAQLTTLRQGGPGLYGKMVLPRGLVETLRDIEADIVKHGADPIADGAMRWFKAAALNSNPIRYNRRNFVGDLQRLFILDPKALLHAPRALLDIIRASRQMSPEYKAALEKGVIDSGFIGQEVADVTLQANLGKLARSMTTPEKAYRILLQNWGRLNKLAQGRENILRLAKFYTDLARVRAGKEPVSFISDTRGITDPIDRAAKTAREALGDYGAFTPFEVRQFTQRMIPFYRWLKINGTFWVKAMGAPGTGARAAATLPVAAARFAVGKAGLLAKVAGGYALVYQWNNTGWRKDIEDKLPDWRKSRFHLVLGVDEKTGKPIIGEDPTPLDDFFRYIGLDGATPDIVQAFKGQKTWKEVATNWYEASRFPTLGKGVPVVGQPFDTLVESFNPFVKAGGNLVGIETFPNPREARGVPPGERVKRAVKSIGLSEGVGAFETATGQRGNRTMGEYLSEYVSPVGQKYIDTERENYFEANNNTRNFLRKKGRTSGMGGDEGPLTKQSRTYYKALEAGDTDKARAARDEWKAAARENKMDFSRSFLQSRSMRDPKAKLGRYYAEWKKQASPRELEQFERARDYYRKVYLKPIGASQ